MKAWYDRTGWERRLTKLYGLPEGWYAATAKLQGGGCAICESPPPEGRRLVVDHDRSCCGWDAQDTEPTCGECVRGLLCSSCNVSLGHVERPEWMAKVLNYMKREVS